MWPTRSAQSGPCLPHAFVSYPFVLYHSSTLAPFQFLKLTRLFPALGHRAWWFLFLISFSAYTLPSWLIYLTDNRLNATLSERLLWLQFKILYISITLTNFLHMRYSHNVGLSSKTISSKRAQIIPIIRWCLSITEYPMLSTELATIIFFLSEWSCKVDYSILQMRILRSIVRQLLRPGITLWGLSRKYYI